MELLIKNVEIIDCNSRFQGDIYINEGIIKEIGINLDKKCQVIHGNNKILMPSFVDLHCHFRDPGFTIKEDLKSGSMAALHGGYTTVNLMANTNPRCSDMDTFYNVMNRRSEEHTSELQSRQYLVCRLLLEKKNNSPRCTRGC